MTPLENLYRDYGRLARFLKGISLRLQLRSALESLLLLASGVMLVLLGSLCAQELKGLFPYLPFIYCVGAIFFLIALLSFGLWRVAAKPSPVTLARGLEKNFPHLRDDLTNSILLFEQIKGNSDDGKISGSLISAQIKKTAGEVKIRMGSDISK